MDPFEQVTEKILSKHDGKFVATILSVRDVEVQGKPGKLVLYETDVEEYRFHQRVGDFETWDSGKTNFTRVQFLDAIGWEYDEFPPDSMVEGSTVVITVKTEGSWTNVTRVEPFNTGIGQSSTVSFG